MEMVMASVGKSFSWLGSEPEVRIRNVSLGYAVLIISVAMKGRL